MNAAAALDILARAFAMGPSIINAVQNFWPKVQSVIGVAQGTITGDDATKAITDLQDDIEAHLAHIEAEAAKL